MRDWTAADWAWAVCIAGSVIGMAAGLAWMVLADPGCCCGCLR